MCKVEKKSVQIKFSYQTVNFIFLIKGKLLFGFTTQIFAEKLKILK